MHAVWIQNGSRLDWAVHIHKAGSWGIVMAPQQYSLSVNIGWSQAGSAQLICGLLRVRVHVLYSCRKHPLASEPYSSAVVTSAWWFESANVQLMNTTKCDAYAGAKKACW